MKRQRGLTIAEALLTMTLVAMLLGLAGYLLGEYGRILKFSAGKERTWLAAQVGLQRAVGEGREAVVVLVPATGASATELRFRKVDPAIQWLPDPIPDPPLPWSPYTNVWEVCYRTDGAGTLLREIGPAASAPTSIQQVCEGVTGFRCDSLADGSYLLVVSIQEEKLTRTLTSRVLPEVP